MKTIFKASALALMLGASSTAYAAMAELKPYVMDAKVDMRASNLIGQRIYATETDVEGRTLTGAEVAEYDDIGEVNDVIMSPEGQVKAVILGVGGFLGMGESDVTVELSSLRFVRDTDNADDTYIVVNANKEQLTALAEQEEAARVAKLQAESGAPAVENAVETAEVKADEATTATGEAVEKTGDAAAAAGAAVVAAGSEAVAEVKETADAVTTETTETAEGTTVTTTENAEAPKVDAETTTETAQVETAPKTGAAIDREVLVRPAVEREGYTVVADTELTTEDLTGKRVYGINDEDIGEVSNLVMAADGKMVEQAVLDVGGFLGIGEREVAVPLSELQIMRNADGDVRVYVQATQEQLENQPEYKAAE